VRLIAGAAGFLTLAARLLTLAARLNALAARLLALAARLDALAARLLAGPLDGQALAPADLARPGRLRVHRERQESQ
jgi:hypothetical protein